MTVQNITGRQLLGAFLAAAQHDRKTAIAAADVALEMFAPRAPEIAPTFGSAQGEAEWWAEFASDTMVIAMLSACLKRVSAAPIIAPNARKRALVAIWNTLDERDRAAFLEFVEPGSKGKA